MLRKKETPRLDLAQIDFPTDRVTFGAVRRAEPELFTDEQFCELRGDEIGIVSAACIESRLARKAFAAAVGLPDPCPDYDRLESITWLHDEYRQLGISSGIRQTRELVLRVEASAIQQANAALGQIR